GTRETAFRREQIGRDVLDAYHAKTFALENAADAREQMIVAAPERRKDLGQHAQRAPIQANFRQRRPAQRADEDEVAAAFAAKQPHRPPELADRNPVMAKARKLRRLADATQREHDRRDAAP